MKAYAQSQTVIPEIDDTYTGWGVYGEGHEIEGENIYGGITVDIVPAAYWIPFIVSLIITILILFAVYHLPKGILETQLNYLENSVGAQGSIVSLILLSLLTTLYIFILDTISVAKENDSVFSRYYPGDDKKYVQYITGIPMTVSVIALFFIVCSGILVGLFVRTKNPRHGAEALTLCFSAPFFQFICHIPSILLAWSTDPFYATKIVVYYAIFIFANYTTAKYAYIVSLTILAQYPKIAGFSKYISSIISLASVILINGTLVTLAIFFVSIPINNNTSLEGSADGITAIFTGGVVVIGAIIAYNVWWQYFFGPISIRSAVHKTLKEMETPITDDDGNWEKLTEEARMIKVLKALIHRQTLQGLGPGPSAQPTETSKL